MFDLDLDMDEEDDVGDGLVGCCDAVDMVVLVYHSACSLEGTVLSMSLMISWIR